jgi:hypothetical protein
MLVTLQYLSISSYLNWNLKGGHDETHQLKRDVKPVTSYTLDAPSIARSNAATGLGS